MKFRLFKQEKKTGLNKTLNKGIVHKIIIQYGYILFYAQVFNVKYFTWFQSTAAIYVFTSIFPTKILNPYFLTHAHSTPNPYF